MVKALKKTSDPCLNSDFVAASFPNEITLHSLAMLVNFLTFLFSPSAISLYHNTKTHPYVDLTSCWNLWLWTFSFLRPWSFTYSEGIIFRRSPAFFSLTWRIDDYPFSLGMHTFGKSSWCKYISLTRSLHFANNCKLFTLTCGIAAWTFYHLSGILKKIPIGNKSVGKYSTKLLNLNVSVIVDIHARIKHPLSDPLLVAFTQQLSGIINHW